MPTDTSGPRAANLTVVAPTHWDKPIIASNQRGAATSSVVDVSMPAFVGLVAKNTVGCRVTGSFIVHIYVDGLLPTWVEFDGVGARSTTWFTDLEGAFSEFWLSPGEHEVLVIVDPYDQIAETDEKDNTCTTVLSFSGGPDGPATGRAPDLIPWTPTGREAPITVAWYADAPSSATVYADEPPIFTMGVKNVGPASVLDGFDVDIYIDGIYVDATSWGWLLAAEWLSWDWGELPTDVGLGPGAHTLRIVLDPGNLIRETNEDNNSFETTFTVAEGPVPDVVPEQPVATAPDPLTQANLVPGWRRNWPGPIVLSQNPDTAFNDPLINGATPYIDVVVSNKSRIEAKAFDIDLFLDDFKVHTYAFPNGLPGGFISWLPDFSGVTLTAGAHTARMVIDPRGTVDESNEDDNTWEYAFEVWPTVAPPDPDPLLYSTGQLLAMLEGLKESLDDPRPVLSDSDDTLEAQALAVADAGYFLITGTSYKDQELTIIMGSEAAYEEWIDTWLADQFASSHPSRHPGLLARRERIKRDALGFEFRWQAKETIVINAEHPFAEVVSTLAHELGHALQDFHNPLQSDAAQSFALQSLREAVAQKFTRVFWLQIEELLGEKLMSFLRHASFESAIDSRFDFWVDNLVADEHYQGYLLLWLTVLDDPALSEQADTLLANNGLDLAGALALYDYLVAMDPVFVDAWVGRRVGSLDEHLPTILSLVKGRLIEGLELTAESVGGLRRGGIWVP